MDQSENNQAGVFPDDCSAEPDSGLLLADGLEPPLFSRETVEAEQAECWDSEEGWRDAGREMGGGMEGGMEGWREEATPQKTFRLLLSGGGVALL